MATKKRRTAKEIAEDNQRSKEAQEAQEKAAQHGIDRVGAIEVSMEIEQAAAASNVVPVKPKPRAKAVKKKATNDIPSDSCVASGDETNNIAGDEAEPKSKGKGKKVKNMMLREAVSAARMKKQIKDPRSVDDNCAHDQKGNLASKKFSLAGQVNNWRHNVEPDAKQTSSQAPSTVLSGTTQSVPCSTTTSKLSSATAATTFSNATEPPPTPTKTSSFAHNADASDDDQSDSDSEERAAAIVSKGKGKAGMKTVVEIEGSSDSEEHAAAIAGSQKVAVQQTIGNYEWAGRMCVPKVNGWADHMSGLSESVYPTHKDGPRAYIIDSGIGMY
ncbi:hypothetical protein C8R48DRAFT_680318 [Suillus tomentosus]|nr:hypothetical protein C8R48DRAFT_680318 [Suillus tomentosus]